MQLDSKKEVLLMDTNPGIFGSTVKARTRKGVTEAQARGALHLHILLWLCYGPLWFSRHIHDEDFRCKMGKYIDKIVTASISEAEHALRDTPRTFTYPKTLHNVSEIKKEVEKLLHILNTITIQQDVGNYLVEKINVTLVDHVFKATQQNLIK